MHSQIKIHNEHLKNINKVQKYKKLNMTEQKTEMSIAKLDKYKKNLNSTSTTEHKTVMSIIKIEKYKKLNMTEHKTYIKTDNNKKLNSTSKTDQKTDMNIPEIDKYIKREQHFYDGTQNRIQL